MLVALTVLALVGCGGSGGELTAWPRRVDFGEIDFLDAVPANGFAETEIVLTSAGKVSVTASLADADFDHLCMQGFSASMLPADIGELSPDQTYSLFAGVCAYSVENGERDTLVEGTIVVETDGDPESVEIPWSFTPVLGLGGDDTGL